MLGIAEALVSLCTLRVRARKDQKKSKANERRASLPAQALKNHFAGAEKYLANLAT